MTESTLGAYLKTFKKLLGRRLFGLGTPLVLNQSFTVYKTYLNINKLDLQEAQNKLSKTNQSINH